MPLKAIKTDALDFYTFFTGVQLEGGGFPCPFLKIKKSAPNFRKKDPDCVHPYVKFTIQNVVLRVSKTKNFKIFPCGAFFSESFEEMFIGVHQFHETSPFLKNFRFRSCFRKSPIILG